MVNTVTVHRVTYYTFFYYGEQKMKLDFFENAYKKKHTQIIFFN